MAKVCRTIASMCGAQNVTVTLRSVNKTFDATSDRERASSIVCLHMLTYLISSIIYAAFTYYVLLQHDDEDKNTSSDLKSRKSTLSRMQTTNLSAYSSANGGLRGDKTDLGDIGSHNEIEIDSDDDL